MRRTGSLWHKTAGFSNNMNLSTSEPHWTSANESGEHLAQMEAASCRDDMWKHLLYINTFLPTQCMGQTWYLSCDMILFIFSPLFIYSFWRGKFGIWQKVAGLAWWAVGLLASISFSVWYVQVCTDWRVDLFLIRDSKKACLRLLSYATIAT